MVLPKNSIVLPKLSNNNPTELGEKMEGLEREGLDSGALEKEGCEGTILYFLYISLIPLKE
jgi:hypothetical protein